jgi:hypothetical protein
LNSNDFNIGFDLKFGYGNVAISYRNESIFATARVESDEGIRRLSENCLVRVGRCLTIAVNSNDVHERRQDFPHPPTLQLSVRSFAS